MGSKRGGGPWINRVVLVVVARRRGRGLVGHGRHGVEPGCLYSEIDIGARASEHIRCNFCAILFCKLAVDRWSSIRLAAMKKTKDRTWRNCP
jgi:hypothetical protein